MIAAFREITRSPTTWIGLLLIFGYWPIARRTPSEIQFELENSARIAVGLVAVVAYTPGLIDALRSRLPNYSHQLVLGIVLSWTGGVGTSSWTLLWRLGGKSPWMLQSNLAGWFLWLVILGGVLHDSAKYVEDRHGVQRRDWRYLWTAFALVVILGTSVVTVQPDLRSVVEWLRPVLDDGY